MGLMKLREETSFKAGFLGGNSLSHDLIDQFFQRLVLGLNRKN
jgi:hypothetical protein